MHASIAGLSVASTHTHTPTLLNSAAPGRRSLNAPDRLGSVYVVALGVVLGDSHTRHTESVRLVEYTCTYPRRKRLALVAYQKPFFVSYR